MKLFRIAEGPWEKLFTGNFQEHEVELYSNPDKILMVIVYEMKHDSVEGAIVELYKVFSSKGEVEAFTETLPKEAIILTKHNEKETLKFLLLGSKPIYVKWVEDEFIREVDLLVKRLATSASMIKDVSKAYELTLREIKESPQDVQTAFFAEPMLVPVLSSSSHQMFPTEEAPKPATKGEIMVGITRDRKRVIEPLSLFIKTIVTDGDEKDRNRAMQVLAESALLSNIPTIFFDPRRKFSTIGETNRNIAELQKYEVNIDPLGFPARAFRARDNLKIDLNLVNPEGISGLFGVGEKDFALILKAEIGKEPVSSMNQLIERIAGMPQTEEFSEFKIHKTARILRLIDIRYPNLFGGPNEIEEMMRQGTANIARASILEIDSLDERSSSILFYTLLKGIFEFCKKSDKGLDINAMVLIPQSQQLFKPKGKSQVGLKEIVQILKDFSKYGVAYIVASEHLIDIEQEIKNDSTAQINVVSDNDISVQLTGKKSYRVLVRPTLSKQAV